MSGRDDHPRAGYPNGVPRETPVDLAAVQADDALLDILSSASRMPSDTDEELARVLVAWRREIHADSNRVLVDTDTALAVISAARRPTRRRNPVFGTFAAAAAVLVIAFSAVGLVAKSAEPGDQLWGVTQVLYSEYARSVEAAAFVRTELNEARTALREGKPEQAKAKLQRIQQRLPAVGEAEGRTDLIARQQDLEKMLVDQSGSSKKDSLDFGSSARPSTSSSAAIPEPTPTPRSSSTLEPSPTPRSSSTPEPSPTVQSSSTPEPSPTPKPATTPVPDPTRQDGEPRPTPPPDDELPGPSAPGSGPPSGSGAGGPGVPSQPG
jgi:Anti-sigma-D factor RsdA to sigma factor binding region